MLRRKVVKSMIFSITAPTSIQDFHIQHILLLLGFHTKITILVPRLYKAIRLQNTEHPPPCPTRYDIDLQRYIFLNTALKHTHIRSVNSTYILLPLLRGGAWRPCKIYILSLRLLRRTRRSSNLAAINVALILTREMHIYNYVSRSRNVLKYSFYISYVRYNTAMRYVILLRNYVMCFWREKREL